jgi:hypothetical protein
MNTRDANAGVARSAPVLGRCNIQNEGSEDFSAVLPAITLLRPGRAHSGKIA